MQGLKDLHDYAKAVDHGGFALARALSIPKSKLSRIIALLEDKLSARLIQRPTRHFLFT
ncbi:MAG: LysR family transcriptional regulator [Methylomonas sp.]